jgi:hypothetical protein
MPSVQITVPLVDQSFPAGTVLGGFRFRLLNSSNLEAASVTVPAPPAGSTSVQGTMNSVNPGSYTYSVSRLNSVNQQLGTPVTGPVTVPEPAPVLAQVPGPGASVVVA